MKQYLLNLVNQLGNYSRSLDQISNLVNKPWALVDSNFEIQKLIFKKNHELILSKNGIVEIGTWEYLHEAHSLLIDRGTDTILCNQGFINEVVMVLKLDGTKDEYFVLANENLLPDLDVIGYLTKLRNNMLEYVTLELTNGKTLEIPGARRLYHTFYAGKAAKIDSEKAPDGIYRIKNKDWKCKIENSHIKDVIHEIYYKTREGKEIMIEQEKRLKFQKGENVYLNGSTAPGGKYRIIGNKNIIVKAGKIIKITTF